MVVDGRVPPVGDRPGQPRRRLKELLADRDYDSKAFRGRPRARGIRPRIARRGTAHGSGLGEFRWVVERSLSRLAHHRRLRFRTDRRADIHEIRPSIDCAMIHFNILMASWCRGF
ncbi:hypothetical protein [Paludisphaera mucosa]|uniref:hypothetical protein n=1 Tax=Paludisphaera mucosa TaxID=3030827 RepID=UPI003F6386D5